MSITKYASLESAQVLGIKGSQERVRTASLDKFAEFDNYRTEDGYLYARIRAISSRVNKNHDGWPSVELAGGQDLFDKHLAKTGAFTVEADKGAEYGYSTFLGKPVFVDHHNHDPERARGVVVDAKLHVEDHRTASELDSYYSSAPDNHLPPTWVELLLEVDAKTFPKLAAAIIEGSSNPHKGIDGFSMGCDVEKSVCNICKNAAHSPDEYCEHVRLKGAHFDYIDPKTGHKTSKKSYEDCYGIRFFELSAVFDPADETALLRELIHHEGAAPPEGGAGDPCPKCGSPIKVGPDWEACSNCDWKIHHNGGRKEGAVGQPYQPADPSAPSPKEHGEALVAALIEQGYAPEIAQQIAEQQKTAATPDEIGGAFDDLHQRLDEGADSFREQRGPLPPVSQMPGVEVGRQFADQQGTIYRIVGQPQGGHEGLMVPVQIDNGPEEGTRRTLPLDSILPETEHPLGPHTGARGEPPTDPPEVDECPECGSALEKDHHEQSEECSNPHCDYGNGRDWDAENDARMEQERFGSVRTAENPLPQSDLLHSPEEVETLRDEQICPVCGSTMDDETCEICGYVEPPDGFGNPDLTKAKEDHDQQQLDQQPPGEDPTAGPPGASPDAGIAQPDLLQGNNPVATAGVKNEVSRWRPSVHPRIAGRINVKETPIKPSQEPQTNEPNEQIVKDEPKPVTSSVRTVDDFIEAAGRGKETNMSNERVAAEPVPAASPDKRVDVEGVGGVIEPSNDAASKADKQVAVDAMGGTGVEGVSADQESVNVDQGDEHSKNIEAIPTKTWSGTDGQTDPVQGVSYPSDAGQGAGRWSAFNVQAYDAEPYPSEDGGLSGGTAVQGTQPADPSGKAEDRVDVLAPVTTPENNSGPTSTWSGTDGNGVTRQQDPVTNETLEGSDIVDLHPRSSSHIFSAVKLADLEIEVGLTDAEEKYERMAELERKSPEVVQASLEYVEKIKTKVAQRKQARVSRRLPSFTGGTLSSNSTNGNGSSEEVDESLFL